MAAAAALAAILIAQDEADRRRGYDDGYDPDTEREGGSLFGFGGYDQGYDEGEADYNRDNE